MRTFISTEPLKAHDDEKEVCICKDIGGVVIYNESLFSPNELFPITDAFVLKLIASASLLLLQLLLSSVVPIGYVMNPSLDTVNIVSCLSKW